MSPPPPPPSSSDTSAEVSKSGITTTATGSRFIPSSTRADGSTRREIKIRPGYRPPEDVEVYKNRTAEAWRTRGAGGVPGAEAASNEPVQEPKSATANKNAKRREARKRAKAAESTGDSDNPGEKLHTHDEKPPAHEESAPGPANPRADEPALADTEKKIKRLKKKLREARELQAKKEQGEGLLQEQFEKVIKISELMRELEKLGVQDGGGDAVEKTPVSREDADSKA